MLEQRYIWGWAIKDSLGWTLERCEKVMTQSLLKGQDVIALYSGGIRDDLLDPAELNLKDSLKT